MRRNKYFSLAAIMMSIFVSMPLGLPLGLYAFFRGSDDIERSLYRVDFSGFEARPTSTDGFLDEGYVGGFERLSLEVEEGAFVGADSQRRVVAVNVAYKGVEEGTRKWVLEGYDARTRQRRYSLHARDCSRVSADDIVYCSSVHDDLIRGYDVVSGKQVAMLAAPGVYVEYFGVYGGLTVLQTTRFPDAEEPSSQLLGVRDGSIAWQVDVLPPFNPGNEVWAKSSYCGLMNGGEVVFCRQFLTDDQIAAGPEYSGTDPKGGVEELISVRTADGEVMYRDRTSAYVFPMGDAWIVRDRSLSPPCVVFSPDGSQRGECDAQEDYESQLFGDFQAGVSFPYDSYVEAENRGYKNVFVNAQGEPIYHETEVQEPVFREDPTYWYSRVGDGKWRAFSSTVRNPIRGISEAGGVVLYNKYLQIVDTGEKIWLPSGMSASVVNGLLSARRIESDDDESEGAELEVYIPRG